MTAKRLIELLVELGEYDGGRVIARHAAALASFADDAIDAANADGDLPRGDAAWLTAVRDESRRVLALCK